MFCLIALDILGVESPASSALFLFCFSCMYVCILVNWQSLINSNKILGVKLISFLFLTLGRSALLSSDYRDVLTSRLKAGFPSGRYELCSSSFVLLSVCFSFFFFDCASAGRENKRELFFPHQHPHQHPHPHPNPHPHPLRFRSISLPRFYILTRAGWSLQVVYRPAWRSRCSQGRRSLKRKQKNFKQAKLASK